jgi:hypothetical protein
VLTALRGLTDLTTGSFDAAQNALLVRGTEAQVGVAEWLVGAANDAGGASTPDYAVPGSADVVKAIPLTHLARQSRFELANVIRGLAEVRQIAVLHERNAVVVRGNPDQLEFAAFLASALDRPSGAALDGTVAQYDYKAETDNSRTSRGGPAVRVYYLGPELSQRGLMELVNAVRGTADITYIFAVSSPRAIALRSTSSRVDLADWLIRQYGAAATSGGASADYQFQDHQSRPVVVRIIRLQPSVTPQALTKMIDAVRAKQFMPYMFPSEVPPTMTVRGTAPEVDQAERLIREFEAVPGN